ncbi:MAG TPA: helix-turn-helix domain-containing protein [bacterium]
MNRVRESRLRAHLSQDELANRSGLARPTISKIERGETIPSGLSRQKIADALGAHISEVFPGESEIEAPISLGKSVMNSIMGIAVVNGSMAAAGVRGSATGEVAVKDAKIEGFLIDRTGEKCPNTLVHLIRDGEKVDSTVSGKQGRFVFKDLDEGEYVLLSEDKFQPVSVSFSDDKFDFEL